MEFGKAGVDLLVALLHTAPRLAVFLIVCIVFIALIALLVKHNVLSPKNDSEVERSERMQRSADSIAEFAKREYEMNAKILAQMVKQNELSEQMIEELQAIKDALMMKL